MTVSTYRPPTFHGVIAAAARIRGKVPRTQLLRYPLLDEALGASVYVKHENHHMIGSFKARGALNAILSAEDEVTGVVASSSGNHGQGVAYAARTVGIPAAIVVPEWANPTKINGIRGLGAEVHYFGTTSSECNERARELARERSHFMIDDFRDSAVIAGAGTVALEIMEEQPSVEFLVIPLGGGALASGCGIAAKGVNPEVRTVAVQSESCPATYLSWKAGHPVQSPCSTIADGLAIDVPEAETVDILRSVIDDAVLVSEDELLQAIRLLLAITHNLAEASGAAGIAGCRRIAGDIAGRRVAVILTGSNLEPSILERALGS